MTNERKGILRPGFSLVLRHQRILWWVFAVNLLLGGLGASGTARAAGDALHHSLAGQRLADGFDLGMLVELSSQPSVKLFNHSGGVFIFAALYFLFLLLVTPGIVTVYLEDRRHTTGEFFGAAGEFFWPFVRLALWSLVPFIALNLVYEAVRALSAYVGDRATTDQVGSVMLLVGCVPVLLLSLFVRLWFDVSQARTVLMNDRATRRSALRMFRPALRQAGSVYWSYLSIGVLVWTLTVIALLIWTQVPARAVGLTFLLLEIVMLVHIFGRLWQKACATTWYRLNPEPVAVVPEPVTYTTPQTAAISDVDAPLSPEVEAVPDISPQPEPPTEA